MKHTIETIVGLLILTLTIYLSFFAYTYQKMDRNFYLLKASFQDATGIIKGSQVLISGVEVGRVKELDLNTKTFDAVVSLEIEKDVSLPVDTKASIMSSGLLGGKFINIEPGIEEKLLSENSQISYTSSSVSFENLLGKLIYSMGKSD